MTTSDFNGTKGQSSQHRLRTALLPHKIWQRAAFLFGAIVLLGVGAVAWRPNPPNQTKNSSVITSKPGTVSKQEETMDAKATPQTDNPSSKTQLTVNGKNIPLPTNGSYHQTTTDNNSRTDIKVDVNNQSTGSSNTPNTSINIQSSSGSSSQSDINNSVDISTQ